MKLQPQRSLIVLLALLLVGLLGYGLELSLPARAPQLSSTYSPQIQPTGQELGGYELLDASLDRDTVAERLKTETGRASLAPEQGAVALTEDLIALGRDAFYRETFGNEYFFTDVLGAINGPINLVSVSRAILALKGKPTTNLQIPLSQTVTVGGRQFQAGTLLNTGLDVPAGSLIPLGMQVHKQGAAVRVGLTCALCHASVDPDSGLILEGAPNNDLNTGLLQAFGTNSTAMFRQTGLKPTELPVGQHRYINASGQIAQLPDPEAVETAVDAQFLAWPPGNFDSSPDNVNNPAQNPSSYTFEAYPYGWSGFASIGWFHGLTTLNNNVHATNSDPTTGAYSSQALLGIDKETYLGVILQNAASHQFHLPDGAKPSEFLQQQDPTPGNPAINEVIKMPGYPKGSAFILDGLMASSPGHPVAAQINGLSAYQNTLAPPPYRPASQAALEQGAAVFQQANCAQCHRGRYFTNHEIVPWDEIKSQPSRAVALRKMPQLFVPPETYPANVSVPLPSDPPVLLVPSLVTAQQTAQQLELAYGLDGKGGYKVPSLVGLHVTVPYLHDGGVAASATALEPGTADQYQVAQPKQIGLAGTAMQMIPPDPAASLRVLLDRDLRLAAVVANRADPDLQATQVDGSGHEYWVDDEAGFTVQQQTDLIEFLLSIDDDPAALP
jgi:hypothetical protein